MKVPEFRTGHGSELRNPQTDDADSEGPSRRCAECALASTTPCTHPLSTLPSRPCRTHTTRRRRRAAAVCCQLKPARVDHKPTQFGIRTRRRAFSPEDHDEMTVQLSLESFLSAAPFAGISCRATFLPRRTSCRQGMCFRVQGSRGAQRTLAGSATARNESFSSQLHTRRL
jgi:hypothetical protein